MLINPLLRFFQPNGNAVPVRDGSLTNHTGAAAAPETANGSHVTGGAGANAGGRIAATEVITTDLDDGMTVITNLTSHQVTYIYDHQSGASPEKNPSPGGSGNSRASSQTTTSPSRSSLGTPTRSGADVKRSGSAREVWKQQMRKKHLPTIFINEAFQPDEATEDQRVENEVQKLPDVTRVSHTDVTAGHAGGGGGGGGSGKDETTHFHYYMSSDFHHDYLRSDSMPRLESESEGGSFQYDDNDIEGILDRAHSVRSSHPSSHADSFGGDASREPKSSALESRTSRQQHLQSADNSDLAERDCTSFSAGPPAARSSTTKSETKSEDGETGSQDTDPGHRKPPRRRAAAARLGSRPSLQHQRTLHDDPEVDTEDVVDAAHDPSENGSDPIESFYPVFENVAETPRTNPVVPSWSEGRADVLSEIIESSHEDEDFSAAVASPESRDGNGSVNDFNVVQTKGNPFSDTSNPTHFRNVADSGDVFLSIDNVTSDATLTDDVSGPRRPDQPSAASDSGIVGSGEPFRPQEQASVLGILVEGGVRIPVSSTPSEHDVDANGESEHHGNHFGEPFDLLDPAGAGNENRNTRNTNPFLEDFHEEQSESAVFPSSRMHNPTQEAHTTQSTREDDTNAVLENPGTNRTVEQPESRNDVEEIPIESVSDGAQPPEDGTQTDNLMITRVGSDIEPPDTAVVLDIVETGSSGSDPSVVLEPYHGDRRPPWMDADFEDDGVEVSRPVSRNPFRTYSFDARSSEDSDAFGSSGDFGSSFGSSAELGTIFGNRTPSVSRPDFGNPFSYDSFNGKHVEDSDSDFLQSSGDSEQLHHTEENGMSYPYPVFDEETERGFEDALALEHVMGGNPYYGNFGRCFESIEEEPEGFSESVNSPHKGDGAEFKTTVVSRPSSRNSSGVELAESNPFGMTNGDSLLAPQGSQPPSKRLSVDPFASDPSPQSAFGGGDEAFFGHSPSHDHEGAIQNGEEVVLNGDALSRDSNPKQPPTVRLTKPSPWPSVDGGPSEPGFDSDFSKTNSLANQGGSFGDKATSGGSEDVNEFEVSLGVSETNHVDGFDDTAKWDGGSTAAKKPPVAPRPAENGGVAIPRSESVTTNHVDPVYF